MAVSGSAGMVNIELGELDPLFKVVTFLTI